MLDTFLNAVVPGRRQRMEQAAENRVNNLLAAVNAAFGGTTGTLSWRDMFGNAHPSEFYTGRNFMALSAVFCAVNMYIGAIISLPRFCQRIDSSTGRPLRFVKTTDHPASRIWSHYANDQMDSDQMMKRMIFDLLFDGNFYAFPEDDGQGRIGRCYYIHPSRIPKGNIRRALGGEKLTSGKTARKGQLLYNVMSGDPNGDITVVNGVQTNGKSIVVTDEDIIHLQGLIPDAEHHRSQGFEEHARASMGLYSSSERMAQRFFKSGWMNNMFLSTDKKLGATLKRDLEEMINDADKGNGVALEELFKARILEYGLKPTFTGLKPDEVQLSQTRAFSVEDVGRWFNIPPALLHSLMGTGITPEDYDKQMMLWIQNGLGQFMANVGKQFKINFLPKSSHPLYAFDFQRLHLYKTVLQDFATALRKLFEIGAIDRLDMAGLMGVHLDPQDPASTQRYVPSNTITVEHSEALAKKADKSLTMLETQIAKQVQEQEFAKDNHARAGEIHEKAMTASEPAPGERPEDDPEGDTGKPQDERNQDNKTQPVPPRDGVAGNVYCSGCDTFVSPIHSCNGVSGSVPPGYTRGELADLVGVSENSLAPLLGVPFVDVKKLLHASLNELHQYELRVVDEKSKKRPTEFADAMNEWDDRFRKRVVSTLNSWSDILPHIEGVPDKPEDIADLWIAARNRLVSENSYEQLDDAVPESGLTHNIGTLTAGLNARFNDTFLSLTEVGDDSSEGE